MSFSRNIDATRGRYDISFVDSQLENGDATPFVKYMFEVFSTVIRDCSAKEKEINNISEELEETNTRKTNNAKNVKIMNERTI